MFLETRSLTKAVKYLLIINVAVYIVLRVTGLYYWGLKWFALIPASVTEKGQIWRLASYLFLHANIFWHLIFNMFALWIFGPEVERRMGRGQFLFYYLFAGIGGGLVFVILNPQATSVTMGASGSILAVLVAFGVLFPEAKISLILPPVTMKARNFVIGYGAIMFLMMFEGPSGINWSVHLGGMIIGYLYLRYMTKGAGKINWDSVKGKLFSSKKDEEENYDEEEIDPILDKISRVGVNGLTREEKEMLKRAGHRLKKR